MKGSVDTETLSMLKEVMEDDFSELITTYIDDATSRVEQLSSFLNDKDSEALRHCAHSLKGSSSNLGATALSDLCFEIESRAKDNQLAEVGLYIEQIAEEFLSVKSALEKLL